LRITRRNGWGSIKQILVKCFGRDSPR
jgi:hypothetical protein